MGFRQFAKPFEQTKYIDMIIEEHKSSVKLDFAETCLIFLYQALQILPSLSYTIGLEFSEQHRRYLHFLRISYLWWKTKYDAFVYVSRCGDTLINMLFKLEISSYDTV